MLELMRATGSGSREHTVTVADGVELWARESGDPTGTPVLLVMGAASSGVLWPDALVERLGRRHRVVVWDHRDTGRSTRAVDVAPYELRDLAIDAVRVLDHLGVERAHVVGMSMGGLLTQLLLLDHPDRVLSATLFCTGALAGAPGGEGLPGPHPDLLALWSRLGETRDEDAEMEFRVEHWQALAGAAIPFPREEVLALERGAVAHGGPADASSATAHARAGTSGLDRGAELAGVRVPTLVVEAPEDPAYPPPTARHLAGTSRRPVGHGSRHGARAARGRPGPPRRRARGAVRQRGRRERRERLTRRGTGTSRPVPAVRAGRDVPVGASSGDGSGQRIRRAADPTGRGDDGEPLADPVLVPADQFPDVGVPQRRQHERGARRPVAPGAPAVHDDGRVQVGHDLRRALAHLRPRQVDGAGQVPLRPRRVRADVEDERRAPRGAVGRQVGGVGLERQLGREEVDGGHGVRHPSRQPPHGPAGQGRSTAERDLHRGSGGIFPSVTTNPRPPLDATDRALLEHLQRDGRTSVADLGRAVNLSASATAERLRRLTDTGVVTGFTAVVDPEALGYTVTAFVRLAYPTGNYKPFHDLLDTTQEVVEAHHVTGDDCFVLKVLARSMRDLERVTGRLATLGAVTTSVVYSSPLPGRHLRPA